MLLRQSFALKNALSQGPFLLSLTHIFIVAATENIVAGPLKTVAERTFTPIFFNFVDKIVVRTTIQTQGIKYTSGLPQKRVFQIKYNLFFACVSL